MSVASLLILQEEAFHKCFNFCHHHQFWCPPLYLPGHLHDCWPGAVPEVVKCVHEVVHGCVLTGPGLAPGPDVFVQRFQALLGQVAKTLAVI